MKAEITINMREDLPIGYSKDKYFGQKHNHSCYEFIYIIRGKAINVTEGGEQLLEVRSLTIMRPEDVHYIRKVEGCTETFEFFNIHVPVSFMQQQFEACSELKKMVLNAKIPTSVKLSNTEFAVICSKAMRLAEMKNSQLRRYLYFNLLGELCSCMVSRTQTNETRASDWFVDLYSKVEASDPAELNYDMVLEMSNVSRTTLWSSFKNFVGMTPTMYINKRKMDEAYRLVLEGKMSHTEISMYLGYNNYTHFYREFLKRYGTSPNGFKKKK